MTYPQKDQRDSQKPGRYSGNYGFGDDTTAGTLGVSPVYLDPAKIAADKEILFKAIESLNKETAKVNFGADAFKVSIDVSLKPDDDDPRIANFDALIKPNEYAVPVQGKNSFFEELDEISMQLRQLKGQLDEEVYLEIVQKFLAGNPLQASIKMVLLGFFHEYINTNTELAFSHYKAAADAGYIDAVYYYIHYILRTRPKLTKDDVATRKALYYCEKLNEREHDGAERLMQEIRHRNWDGETKSFRPPSFDFFDGLLPKKLAINIRAEFSKLKPTKVRVGSSQLPRDFQQVILSLKDLISSEDPIFHLITAELWQLCYTRLTTLDNDPVPQRFCIGQAAHAYRAAIYVCKRKKQYALAAWAFLELRKLIEYCLNPSIKHAELRWKNSEKQTLARTRYYVSGTHYNPTELALCRYYYSTALYVLNPKHELKIKHAKPVSITTLIQEDIKQFTLVWVMALQQEQKEKNPRMVNVEKKVAPLDRLIGLLLKIFPQYQQEFRTEAVSQVPDVNRRRTRQSRDIISQALSNPDCRGRLIPIQDVEEEFGFEASGFEKFGFESSDSEEDAGFGLVYE